MLIIHLYIFYFVTFSIKFHIEQVKYHISKIIFVIGCIEMHLFKSLVRINFMPIGIVRIMENIWFSENFQKKLKFILEISLNYFCALNRMKLIFTGYFVNLFNIRQDSL